jgi:hypothetical protein
MNITLSPEERELLEGILSQALGEMREEVYHADEHRFKNELKRDEVTLRGLLDKVRAQVAAGMAV